MAEGWGDGGRQMVGTADGESAGFGDFTVAREHLPALLFRPLGEHLAQEVGARRSGGRPLCGRYRFGIPVSGRCRSFPGEFTATAGNVWAGATPRKDAPDRVRQVRRGE